MRRGDEAALAAEKGRRASSKPDDADQDLRRTSEPEPKTRSKAKATLIAHTVPPECEL